MLIDTGGPSAPIRRKIEELKLTVSHVLCTHHHYDHVAHNDEYREAYGGANKIVIAIKAKEGDIFTPEFFEILAEVTDLTRQARRAGEDIVDLGMGNPDLATPDHVIDKICEAARDPRNHQRHGGDQRWRPDRRRGRNGGPRTGSQPCPIRQRYRRPQSCSTTCRSVRTVEFSSHYNLPFR